MVALRMKRSKGGEVSKFTWNQSTGPKEPRVPSTHNAEPPRRRGRDERLPKIR